MSEPVSEQIAAVPCVVLAQWGDQHPGSRSRHCGMTLLGERVACAACGTGGAISHIRLADTERVRTCTVVNRSYPGVRVSLIAAVVEIEGGRVVRGTLRGPVPDKPGTEIGKRV